MAWMTTAAGCVKRWQRLLLMAVGRVHRWLLLLTMSASRRTRWMGDLATMPVGPLEQPAQRWRCCCPWLAPYHAMHAAAVPPSMRCCCCPSHCQAGACPSSHLVRSP